ncbi:serine hydrolase domain-containing protein [Polaribacter uvawellassae]|uniref:serine hydrolase domain-containing protein n=1 Tax=Polaribacter uvawellassae TaxID=3133495 RepID=UPI00321B655E
MKIKKLIPFFLLLIVFGCSKSENDDISTSELDWFTFSTPEAQGMDSNVLNNAYQKAISLGFVDGIIISKNGYIVGEKYFNNYSESKPHNVKSVSKSILSAITYFAINEGAFDMNDKVLNFFPEYNNSSLDTRIADITIEHLLKMRMGIPAEFDDNYNVYTDLYNSSNWIQSTLEFPLKNDPGDAMNYNTFQTHLLSGIITKATKKNTFDFASETLFKLMKIDIDSWEQDAQGYYFGGNSMFFTPREMYLFGKLYLNKGKLFNTQIIPESWVNASLTSSTNFSNLEIGAFKNYNYGYLWWLGEINNYKLFLAYGYGGQLIAVFPDIDLIIITTTENAVTPTDASNQEVKMFNFISENILPAIK